MTRYEGNREPVIIRARDAGVHFGELVAYEERMVWLEGAIRLWKWKAAGGIALSGVATAGIDPRASKLDALLPRMVITDACELLFCTEEAAASIRSALWAK